MTVRCRLCGQEWPRDPALDVPCPACHAATGRKCRRPSGHSCGHSCEIHAERDRAAMEAGKLEACPMAGPPRPALEADRQFALRL
jgi:hypothetical protein